MAKFETIKAGDILWDRHREKIGNTTMSREGEWEVRIISVDPHSRSALVSWNGNPPRTMFSRSLDKLKRKPKHHEVHRAS